MPEGKDEVKVLDCQVKIITKKGKVGATVIPLFESGALVEFEVGNVGDGSLTILWRPKGQKVKKGK